MVTGTRLTAALKDMPKRKSVKRTYLRPRRGGGGVNAAVVQLASVRLAYQHTGVAVVPSRALKKSGARFTNKYFTLLPFLSRF